MKRVRESALVGRFVIGLALILAFSFFFDIGGNEGSMFHKISGFSVNDTGDKPRNLEGFIASLIVLYFVVVATLEVRRLRHNKKIEREVKIGEFLENEDEIKIKKKEKDLVKEQKEQDEEEELDEEISPVEKIPKLKKISKLKVKKPAIE